MKDFIKQLYGDDCGFASLKMVLASQFHNPDYLYITNPKAKGSYNLYELISEGKKWGVELRGYQLSDFENLTFPMIALLKENERYHYVVVDKRHKNMFFLRDAGNRKRKIPVEKFQDVFSGYALFVSKAHEIRKPRNAFTSFPKAFLMVGLLINSLIIIICAWLYQPNPFLYIILFSFTFFLQLLIKGWQIHLLKKRISFYYQKAEISQSEFQHFIILLKEKVALPFVFIEKILICGLLFGVFFKNHLSLFSAMTIVFSVLLKELMIRLQRKQHISLALIESELFYISYQERLPKLAIFYKKLLHFLFSKAIIDWAIYILMALLTLINLYLNNDFSLSHFVIVCGASLIAFTTLEQCLKSGVDLASWRYDMLKIQNDFRI